MKKVLYNCESNNCCAFCKLHHCAMTVKQMKKKQCLKKHCHHLVRYEEHPIWQQRARDRELRNKHRKAKKSMYS